MENFYYVQFLTRHGFDSDYVEADTAADACNKIRAEFGYELVSVSVRKTLYKEWNYELSVSGDCLSHSH
jgi:hypothetical protein